MSAPAIEAYIVLVVAAFNLILSGIIVSQDFRNHVNIAFGILASVAAAWGFSVGLYILTPETYTEWIQLLPRLVYFFGISIAPVFLYFSVAFDAKKKPPKSLILFLIGRMLYVTYLYFFTNQIITGPIVLENGGRGFLYGPWRFIVDIELWGYFAIALFVLARKYKRFTDQAKQQVLFIMLGTYPTLAVAGLTNDIFLTYGYFQYFWIGPTALIIWLTSVAYSVAQLQLFNVRVIAAEALIFLLWLMFLVRTILSQDETDFVTNAGFFVAVMVLGVFLINSVLKKVRQREMIEGQEKELAFINTQQESLLNFISHEVKGYFAKSEAVFSGIVENDYGPPAPALRVMATSGLTDVRTGVSMVMSILDASSMKRGTVAYRMSLFDIKKTVGEVAEEMRPEAEAKGLQYVVTGVTGPVFAMRGDETKIRKHVIRNLIDNAIRYTPVGSIKIELSCTASLVRFTVEDTGVGITPEDMPRLFTEGGHGKDSLTVNVHSTGYGLYIAKQVIEAHGGTVEALSSGQGKGAQFVVELPVSTYPT